MAIDRSVPAPPPLVSIVLVSYNDRAHLPAALRSIRDHAGDVSREVILVDNASTDGSLEAAAAFPEVRVIRNGANVGFARANNAAAASARGEFVLFLNTDAALGPGALAALLDDMAAHPETGASGPRLRDGRGKPQVSFGSRPTLVREAARKLVLNRLRASRLRSSRGRRDTEWVSGAFLLARRAAFDAAGGFDEGFFLFFEDIDLCLRMRALGWTVAFVPAAEGFHAGGASTSARKLRSRLEYRRSQLRFYRRHAARGTPGLKLLLRLSILAMAVSGRLGPRTDPSLAEFRDLLRERD